MAGDWRNGLFDCFGSMGDCLLGYCCPCIEAGIATKNAGLGTGCAALQCFFYPLLMPLLRNQVREQRGIDGSVVGDVASGWCCPCCLAIQVKREFD